MRRFVRVLVIAALSLMLVGGTAAGAGATCYYLGVGGQGVSVCV